MTQNAVRDIAEFILSTSLETIDPDVRDTAARAITDTIGVMLAGTTSEVAEPLQRLLQSRANSGTAGVIGWGGAIAPDLAALVNGTLGHALDFDDVVEMYPGHPSAVTVAALLATADPEVLDGASFLEAYVVGIEVGAKIGDGLGPGHYMRGWHATATVGIFAALGALAKVLRLDQQTILRAFGIAGSLASGLRCNFGTMTKPLHAGWAARCAVNAAELACLGWTATEAIFDVPRGFLDVYGDDASSSARIGATLGRPYVFTTPGIGLKRYPCYNGVHRAIDATLEAWEQAGGVGAGDVRRVTCRVAPGRLGAVLYPRPTTGLEGKFSYEYAIAAALLDGTVGLRSFSDDAVQRAEVQELLERIEVVEDPTCAGRVGGSAQEAALGTGGFTVVSIVAAGGEEYEVRVAQSRGAPGNPLSWSEVLTKFSDCAREAGVPTDVVRIATSHLRAPELIPDIRETVRALSIEMSSVSRV